MQSHLQESNFQSDLFLQQYINKYHGQSLKNCWTWSAKSTFHKMTTICWLCKTRR